jgi:hypothetical protein
MDKCCPYCNDEASQLQVGEDDSIDYCKTCDVVIEGETVLKLPIGKENILWKQRKLKIQN